MKIEELYSSVKTLDEALQIIAEQDMRIGKLTRENEHQQDTLYRHRQAIRDRKRQAGYDDSVSFDAVWDEILEKSKNRI